ncbi:PAS domain S-box protein [Cytobacillus sp. IB215316]|uniref:PAS domain S-box protein n=1 Tax=Cytobacillus sp. IB215316 TaxID=3097354 RepID=UPI002A13297D|nr:PAS domain S-box protein [Cytobacillus sp. IB215316]MDX8361903.1 PAS domain S-box protein [Cytobacillus sp. IB215316]
MNIKKLYKLAFESAGIAMAIYDCQGEVGIPLAINDAFCKFLGYTREELCSKTVEEISHPDDYKRDLHKISCLLTGHIDEIATEKRYIHKSGRIVWGELKGILQRNEDKSPQFAIVQIHDITHRKSIEKELLESKEKYESLIQDSLQAFYVVRDEKVIFVNPAGCELSGFSKEEIIGSNIYDYFTKDRVELAEYNYNQLLMGNSYTNEEQIVITNKGERVIEYTATKTVYEEEEAIQVIARDITERKKYEEMLVKSEKLALVGKLAAGVAHEIRNPLTTIKGFTQLLQMTKEYNEQHAAIMMNELSTVETIIDEFLSLAKTKSTSSFEMNDLHSIINRAITLVKTNTDLHNIELGAQFDETIPLVECEDEMLIQVFTNIIQNAIESMDTGFITMSTHRKNDVVTVAVVDNGCGIPKDRLKNLGEPFYSTKEKGTGLGLMISYKIIEQHKGQMSFYSNPGEGTRVEIILPIKQKNIGQINEKLL